MNVCEEHKSGMNALYIIHTDSFYAGVYNCERRIVRIVIIATINLLVR